jgi:hypothetical protein
MGNPDIADAQPVIDLFKYMTSILGPENRLHTITGTRLAVVSQIIKTEEELGILYSKMKLPEKLAPEDFNKNQRTLEDCREMAKKLL